MAAPLSILVEVIQGPNCGDRLGFSQSGRYLFGCDADANFQLSAEDRFVSGRHFHIELDGQHCFLQDLGGPNQTRVNGRAVRRCELQDQDEVQVGRTRLKFCISRTPLCVVCKRPVLPSSTSPQYALKDPEGESRATSAHESCVPRDQSFGREFGEYVCYCRLGGGSFGEVFLAYHPSTARLWAVKTARQGGDETALKRFRREARLLQILRHPNIVHCVGSGITPDGTTYLVSEYVNGGDLQQLIDKDGPLPLDRAIRLMSPLLEALVYLQSPPTPTEHRDIKPANVLLMAEGGALNVSAPRLADFGLGKVFGVITTPLTREGQFMGTPVYAAPEIIQSGILAHEGFHPALDVYSLGAMFYFVLTRALPFDFPRTGGRADLLHHILSNEPIPIRKRDPSVPRMLAGVIDQACRKDPAKRFQNAATFQKAFLNSV